MMEASDLEETGPDDSMSDKSRRRLRRRLPARYCCWCGLGVAGGLAATLTPTPQVAVADESQSALLRTGKQLFETSCVTCHGANLQGVPDRGPSLIGVGEAAVYFQVTPAGCRRCAAKPRLPARTRSSTSPRPTRWAPTSRPTAADRVTPATPTAQSPMSRCVGTDLARGGDLFRLNCASCHNFTGKGGALSSGKYAPDLTTPTPAADLHRDADRPAEHAEVLRSPAVAGGEEGHRRLRPDGRPTRPNPAVTGSAGSAPRRKAWRCGSSAWSPRSGWHCGLGRGHERQRAKADRA